MSQSVSTAGAIVSIPFTQIPAPWDVPGSRVEVAPSYQQVGVLPMPVRALIIGQMIPAGTAVAGVLYQNIVTAAQGTALGGAGSIIDGMVTAHLATNTSVPLDIICVADAVGAAKATWEATFGGPATAAGTVAINIAGQRVTIGTMNGDTATTAATEFAAAVNAMPGLPVIANAFANVVEFISKNGGLAGNDISFVVNPAPGDVLPPGLTVAIAPGVVGATNPSIAAALALVDTTWYCDIAAPWQDVPNVSAMAAEATRRYNAMVRLDARMHVPQTGTLSQQIAAAAAVNAPFVYQSPMTAPGSPPWTIAAAVAGVCAQRLNTDPSLQMNEIALPGIVGPLAANVPDDAEKEMLLVGGCSVFRVAANGTVTMQRYVSTYRTNAQGVADPAWFDVMEQAVSSRIRYDWQTYRQLIYPSNKLAPDGSLAAASDSTVCTPVRLRGSWTARMMSYARAGWIVNEVADAARSVFEIDPNDPNRAIYQIYYTRIGNLFVDAGQLLFNVGGE